MITLVLTSGWKPLIRIVGAVFCRPKNNIVCIPSSCVPAGTWAWGNKLLWGYDEGQDNALQAAFNYATDRGINLWDTADSYGTGALNGRSEELLGKFKREYAGSESQRSNIRIATKFAPYPWRVTSQQFAAACRGSLRRLGSDNLAIGQLHWSTANYQPLQERALWDGLVRMYDQGLVQAVGVSNYGPKQMEKIAKYLAEREVPLVTAQVQFSLVSRGPEQQAIQSVCKDLGVHLISYSPLGLGLLTGKYDADADNLPAGPRSLLFRQILPGLAPLISEMRKIADARTRVCRRWHLTGASVKAPSPSLEQSQ